MMHGPSTLSLVMKRTTLLQKALGIAFVLILMGGLSMIFTGTVLSLSYYMDHLSFVSSYFLVLPWLLVGGGILTFLYSMLGFLFSTCEKGSLIIIWALLAVPLCLMQFTSVFVGLEVRREIVGEVFRKSHGHIVAINERDTWDFLQSRLRCCGAFGYRDYVNSQSNQFKCVPDSCCFDYRDPTQGNCTSAFTRDTCANLNLLAEKIYIRGCMDILGPLYEAELATPLLIYGLLGTLLGIIKLCAGALAFGYYGQLRRRHKKEFSNSGMMMDPSFSHGETLRRAQEDNEELNRDLDAIQQGMET